MARNVPLNETLDAAAAARSPVHKALRLLSRLATSDAPLALPAERVEFTLKPGSSARTAGRELAAAGARRDGERRPRPPRDSGTVQGRELPAKPDRAAQKPRFSPQTRTCVRMV